jgi:hypothetical protein
MGMVYYSKEIQKTSQGKSNWMGPSPDKIRQKTSKNLLLLEREREAINSSSDDLR